MSSTVVIIIYIVALFAIMYFLSIRPERKKQKELQALVNSLEIGDSIVTTSGFYGIIIDITDDMVIVEFGQNKNCRIPMDKTAIANVEKLNKPAQNS